MSVAILNKRIQKFDFSIMTAVNKISSNTVIPISLVATLLGVIVTGVVAFTNLKSDLANQAIVLDHQKERVADLNSRLSVHEAKYVTKDELKALMESIDSKLDLIATKIKR